MTINDKSTNNGDVGGCQPGAAASSPNNDGAARNAEDTATTETAATPSDGNGWQLSLGELPFDVGDDPRNPTRFQHDPSHRGTSLSETNRGSRSALGGRERERWTPKPLSTLTSSEGDARWILKGYIAAAVFTLFTGLWKGGKTTFLAHLLRALAKGLSLGGLATTACRVLVITEESESIWKRRRDDLGLGDHVEIISRPFLGRPDTATWTKFIRHIAELVKDRHFSLVVFDSLPNLSPVKDENDASEAIAALMPLYAVTKFGAAVLLVSHPRKGDATEGQATRGTGALPAFVDIIVEMRRYDPERHTDNRRVLRAYSRYEETPAELVLDYDPATGYRAAGTQADVTADGRIAAMLALLPLDCEIGMTIEEILAKWPPGIPTPGAATVKGDLATVLWTRVDRTGSGVRGKPFRYARYVLDWVDNSTPEDRKRIDSPQDRKAITSPSDSIPASSTPLEDGPVRIESGDASASANADAPVVSDSAPPTENAGTRSGTNTDTPEAA